MTVWFVCVFSGLCVHICSHTCVCVCVCVCVCAESGPCDCCYEEDAGRDDGRGREGSARRGGTMTLATPTTHVLISPVIIMEIS